VNFFGENIMKWIHALLIVIVLVGIASAAEPDERPDELKILLTYGGHGFQEEPFFAMFDALPGISYTKAPLPQDAGLLKPGLEAEYDAIVMYDMVSKFSPEQQQAFVALLNKGIGVVSLHHNLGAHRDWDEFAKIIGGKFVFADCQLEGEAYTKSTWSHGEQLKVQIADPDHPVTRGIEPFEIHDESYGGYYTASDVHVLLTTDHPKNDPELAWTTRYGNSRVLYLMLGHDRLAWQNPAFPKILLQGIRWAAGQQ
jgi:type 1 glutamine amidotransferase